MRGGRQLVDQYGFDVFGVDRGRIGAKRDWKIAELEVWASIHLEEPGPFAGWDRLSDVERMFVRSLHPPATWRAVLNVPLCATFMSPTLAPTTPTPAV